MSYEQGKELIQKTLAGEESEIEKSEKDIEIQTSAEPKFVIRDHRFYVNSIERGAETMRKNGVRVALDRDEDEKRIVYTIMIPKAQEKTA